MTRYARRTPRPCSVPGCPELSLGGMCDSCLRRKRREHDARRPNSSERGYNARWAKTRVDILTCRPFCEGEGCSEPATEVHHLDGLGPLGPRGHDPANLQALCHGCHSRITATEHGLGGPSMSAPLPPPGAHATRTPPRAERRGSADSENEQTHQQTGAET